VIGAVLAIARETALDIAGVEYLVWLTLSYPARGVELDFLLMPGGSKLTVWRIGVISSRPDLCLRWAK